MLMLIFQLPLDNAVFQRTASGDDIVFFENAVFQLHKNGLLSDQLQGLLNTNRHLFVLSEALESRGLQADELVLGIEVIDYFGMVKLTENNQIIQTWS